MKIFIDKAKMRYSAVQSPEPSEIDKDLLQINEEMLNKTLLNDTTLIKFRRGITKNNERIIGDLSKASIISDLNMVNKKVVFYPIDTDASMITTNQPGHRRRLTNQKYSTQSVDMFGKPKGIRPLTAKNYYKVNYFIKLFPECC